MNAVRGERDGFRRYILMRGRAVRGLNDLWIAV